MLVKFGAFAALAAAPLALAQTFTSCNPLEKECSPDTGLNAATYSADLTQGASAGKGWTQAAGTSINYGPKGAEFTITGANQAPTWESDFHILFGTLEVTMQAATGVGIVSSIVLESSDLDEIDWEFLGGDFGQAQSNYFGKGDTTTYDRGKYHPVSSPQTTMHTYKIDWSPDRFIFSIDGNPVRTVTYTEAQGGTRYPQTPMRIKLGNWAGGGPGSPDGTVQWAGGKTDFSASPFTMYVQSIKVTNTYPASQYVWTDRSGNWQSIKAVGGSGAQPGSNAASPAPPATTASPSPSPKPTTPPATTSAKPTTTAPATSKPAASTTDSVSSVKPVARPPATNSTPSPSSTTMTTLTTATSASPTSSRTTATTTTASSTPTPAGTNAASGRQAVTGLLLCFTLVTSFWLS